MSAYKSFKTKRNDGSDGNRGFSNQCMWLSILAFVNKGLNNPYISLENIRNIASANGQRINGRTEEFDSGLHSEAIKAVAETFDLQIHIYHRVNMNGKQFISNKPNVIFGNHHARHVVSIISYGRHFELITSIGDRSLYGQIFGYGEEFVPDKKLIIGKETKNLNCLEKEQSEKLDELLDGYIFFETLINNSNNREKEINIKHEELYNKICSVNDNTELNNDIELKQTIINSCNTIIDKLSDEKIVLQTNISKFKENLTIIKSNIDLIVN